LHAASVTTSRATIAPPSGRDKNVSRAIAWALPLVRSASAPTVCVWVWDRPVSGAASSYVYIPRAISTTRNVPVDSAAAWSALFAVIGLVWTCVVYDVYGPGEPSALLASCASTKLTATLPSVSLPVASSAAPLPSLSTKLTVAVPSVNESLVTLMSTPDCVNHGAGLAGSPGRLASPGASSAPGPPGGPAGPGGPSHAPTHAPTRRAKIQRMRCSDSHLVPS